MIVKTGKEKEEVITRGQRWSYTKGELSSKIKIIWDIPEDSIHLWLGSMGKDHERAN